jgi:hypothetical protein
MANNQMTVEGGVFIPGNKQGTTLLIGSSIIVLLSSFIFANHPHNPSINILSARSNILLSLLMAFFVLTDFQHKRPIN